MKTTLDLIIENKQKEILQRKAQTKLAELTQMENFQRNTISLKNKLLTRAGIIAEIKRKSPSAGEIVQNLDVVNKAIDYRNQGAAAISVLTDFDYFGGSLEDLQKVRNTVDLPILQKDFIIDEYQLFEAKANGADVILLIAACLDKSLCNHLAIIAKSLGLEVILEVFTFQELTYFSEDIDFVMVNNRDLKQQVTNLENSEIVFPFIPEDVLKISASGIKTTADLLNLKKTGYSAFLVGESILKEADLEVFTNVLSYAN